MKRHLIALLALCAITTTIWAQEFKGFFDFTYQDKDGKIILMLSEDRLEQEFIYVNSLSAGIGSNDIGLDRGQLGQERIVKFIKAGDKVMMLQPNQDYRATSENVLERKAVEEAFAQSVIWGFKIDKTEEGVISIDMTEFLLRDAHGVTQRLKRAKQGSYSLDKSRSAISMDRTKSFPQNTEFDAMLTFTGQPEGQYIRSVTPSADAITVHQHHSFIALPDNNYKPRAFHPYSGYNQMSYYDYAVAIEDPIEQRFIYRHRLEKVNPNAAISPAKEPIIYYMDPGCPDPIKTALMEGAAWWDQAFQAAGYAPGAFQVKELPEGADMLDVRYNVIQWVHRSTRGWSYGSSVSDPRTGEILKGHVSLGSLRVRQDFLIAQGLLSPYANNDENHDKMLELALARLRQLAAHEVGHTIGLAHNFAASTNDRSSVMDYPHPWISMKEGEISFENVYDDKIGDWDKFSITYGYKDFPQGVDESKALQDMVLTAQKGGYLFITDSDARPEGGAHPHGHLWDSGANAVDELNRLMPIRRSALERISENSITKGTPMSEIEKVLVPVYLLHRYQVDAVSKLVGGVNYQYYVKGDAYDHEITAVDHKIQGQAVQALLNTLSAENLRLPDQVIQSIAPPAFGYQRSRETFNGKTNLVFDVMAPAESHTHMTLDFLLHKDRLTRIDRQFATGMSPISLEELLDQIGNQIFAQSGNDAYAKSLNAMVQKVFFAHLIGLSFDPSVDMSVGAAAYSVAQKTLQKGSINKNGAHYLYLNKMLKEAESNPGEVSLPKFSEIPPGSPIGCSLMDHLNH